MIYNTTYHDQNILQKRKMVQYQQWTVILPHSLLNCTVIFIQLLSSIAVHSASTYIFSASPDSTSVFQYLLCYITFTKINEGFFPFNIYFYHLVVPSIASNLMRNCDWLLQYQITLYMRIWHLKIGKVFPSFTSCTRAT